MKLKKALNILEFFKSIMFFDLIISAVAFIVIGIESSLFVFISIGFLLSILIFEIRYKNNYLFYHNNGVSKLELIAYSYLITFLIALFPLIIL